MGHTCESQHGCSLTGSEGIAATARPNGKVDLGYRAAEGDRVVIKSVGDCVGHDDGWASLDDAWASMLLSRGVSERAEVATRSNSSDAPATSTTGLRGA